MYCILSQKKNSGIRRFTCSHIGARWRLGVALFIRCITKAQGLFLQSILCVGWECWAIGIIFFAGQGAVLWGQSPETSEASQAAEAINPQYEYNVKAAFLYSFGRYVEWPKDAFAGESGAFIIGLYGEDHIGQVLDKIAQSKTIQGRCIVIQRMTTIEEFQPCNILFVVRSVPVEQQHKIIKKFRDKATLIVGETRDSPSTGAG